MVPRLFGAMRTTGNIAPPTPCTTAPNPNSSIANHTSTKPPSAISALLVFSVFSVPSVVKSFFFAVEFLGAPTGFQLKTVDWHIPMYQPNILIITGAQIGGAIAHACSHHITTIFIVALIPQHIYALRHSQTH